MSCALPGQHPQVKSAPDSIQTIIPVIGREGSRIPSRRCFCLWEQEWRWKQKVVPKLSQIAYGIKSFSVTCRPLALRSKAAQICHLFIFGGVVLHSLRKISVPLHRQWDRPQLIFSHGFFGIARNVAAGALNVLHSQALLLYVQLSVAGTRPTRLLT